MKTYPSNFKKKKARLENRKAKDTRLQIFKILRLYNDNKKLSVIAIQVQLLLLSRSPTG